MLDGILGRGFSSKCKSLIKPTRTRIDVLRKRKEATQRFLKGNLSQLLSNGLDINAFGRTEEFLAGQNLLSCYDFIEQCCEYILKQLPVMQKQSACPEDCREAVGSLMFAAARFSDLPELRDLRDTFQERYGNSLEHYANKQFVEKLALRPATMEKKIQLLQDIALEFSIKWDSRGFERRMANQCAFGQDQPKKCGPLPDHDDKRKLPHGNGTVTNSDKRNHSSKEKSELSSDRQGDHNGRKDTFLRKDELDLQIFGREDVVVSNHKSRTASEQSSPKIDSYDISSQGRREFNDNRHEYLSVKGKKEDTAPRRVRPGNSSSGKRADYVSSGYDVHHKKAESIPKRDGWSEGKSEGSARVAGLPGRGDGEDVSSSSYKNYGQLNIASSTNKAQEEETVKLKPYSSNSLPPPYTKREKLVPPPYIKSKDSKYGVNAEAKQSGFDYAAASKDETAHKRDNAVDRSDREGFQRELHNPKYDDQVAGPRIRHHGHEKDPPYRNEIPLPKPRSMRKKHLRSSSSGRDDLGNTEDDGAGKNSSSSRRRDSSRKGLQILFDDEHSRKDEEERVIDRLLLHYSKKPSSCDPEKVRRKLKSHASHQMASDGGGTPHRRSADTPDVQAELVPPPTRSISLPHELTGPTEASKVYARANSFQPDKPARHVHPKLPDYDDLAARFATLRGR